MFLHHVTLLNAFEWETHMDCLALLILRWSQSIESRTGDRVMGIVAYISEEFSAVS